MFSEEHEGEKEMIRIYFFYTEIFSYTLGYKNMNRKKLYIICTISNSKHVKIFFFLI